MKKVLAVLISISFVCVMLTSCNTTSTSSDDNNSGLGVLTDISTNNIDFELTDRDKDPSFDESTATTISDNENVVTLTKEGVYIVSGTHSQIIVKASDNAKIQIVLKNTTIANSDGPAIYIKSGDKVFITAYEGTENTISDTSAYSSDYESNKADGAIFSKSDLTINGSGIININGNYKSGIVSKDDLVLCGVTLKITSVGCAVEGKDCIKASNADVTVTSGGDGIKSTNEDDSNRGFVTIDSGTYNIASQNDAIQAATVINICGGTFNLTTGGGSQNASTSAKDNGWGMWGKQDPTNSTDSTKTESAKGIKATSLIKISSAEISIDSSDDSVHSNSDVQIDRGKFSISSGDDGIHADDALIINGGEILISKSYEGLEGTAVNISGGNIDLTASDDGINAAGGNDSSAMGGRPGQNTFNSTSDATITISGGYIVVNASGDGVDSNGSVTMTGGVLLVSGPTDNGNGAFDYDTTASISGGTAILAGSSGMAQTFSDDSSQYSVMYTLDSSVNGGTSISVTDSEDTVIASFLPSKQFNNIVVSSPKLEKNKTYSLNIGGTVSESDENGYTDSGSVSEATDTYDIKMSSKSVTYGSAGGNMPGGAGGMGGGKGNPQGGATPDKSQNGFGH